MHKIAKIQEELIQDKNELMKKLDGDWIYYVYSSIELMNDKDVIIKTIKQYPNVLSIIPNKEIYYNREIALIVVAIDPILTNIYFSHFIEEDKEFRKLFMKNLRIYTEYFVKKMEEASL